MDINITSFNKSKSSKSYSAINEISNEEPIILKKEVKELEKEIKNRIEENQKKEAKQLEELDAKILEAMNQAELVKKNYIFVEDMIKFLNKELDFFDRCYHDLFAQFTKAASIYQNDLNNLDFKKYIDSVDFLSNKIEAIKQMETMIIQNDIESIDVDKLDPLKEYFMNYTENAFYLTRDLSKAVDENKRHADARFGFLYLK